LNTLYPGPTYICISDRYSLLLSPRRAHIETFLPASPPYQLSRSPRLALARISQLLPG
jgi:hypothetical protein